MTQFEKITESPETMAAFLSSSYWVVTVCLTCQLWPRAGIVFKSPSGYCPTVKLNYRIHPRYKDCPSPRRC